MKRKLKFAIIFLSALLIFSCNSGESYDNYEDEVIENINPDDDNSQNQDSETSSSGMMIFLIISGIILGPGLIFFFWYFIPLGLWYEAWLSGVKVGWGKLIKMKFQKIPRDLILKTLIEAKNAGFIIKSTDLAEKYLADVDITVVTDTAIRAVNAGIDINFNDLAAKYLAKVDVEKVMHALITAKNADLDLTINQLSGHYLANVDVIKVVEALITAHNAGYDEFTLDDLKEHYLSNGNVKKTVDAFVAVKKANLQEVTFEHMAAIDLAGIDVISAADSAITPRVIETNAVTGISRDGVQLIMKLKLTVRADLKNIIGGASEDTVLARVDESLSSEIGISENHYYVLENPFELADKVEQKNLGQGTAFEILSIDVSEIEVGRDVHAVLETERAKAKAEIAKASLISAEEKVKKAMASAFMDGKLSITDYQEIMNTEADTHMRKKLGDSTKKTHEHENDENKEH